MSFRNINNIVRCTRTLTGYVAVFIIIIMMIQTTFFSNLVFHSNNVHQVKNLYLSGSNDVFKRNHKSSITHRDKKSQKIEYFELKWMENLRKGQRNVTKRYFLTEILMVRIYEQDKAKWTIKELKQWLHYMLFAGIEHFYLCDHFENPKESVAKDLKRYIDLNLITYIPFSQPRRAMSAQVQCYQSVHSKYKQESEWQLTIDMDEYPFIHNDTKEGFLVRYLKNLPPDVTVVYMPNFLMLGQGDRTRDIAIERINRIHSLTKESNALGKNIYKPQDVSHVDIHSVRLRRGTFVRERGERLKMLHYWGARLQAWGPDTPKILNMTVEFNMVRNLLAPVVRKSLLAFGEFDAFSNTTGP